MFSQKQNNNIKSVIKAKFNNACLVFEKAMSQINEKSYQCTSSREQRRKQAVLEALLRPVL
ncbi:MAG: hypothetical protein K0R66_524 [Gammaproteobacteria bacterium]|jgi:hypothetical protein|nr:hypothetical protein [Gammaproteobacteria bacterium]